MGLRESLQKMQKEQDIKNQKQQERRDRPLPDDLARGLAADIYQYIVNSITGSVKARSFKYYKGTFGGKTNCRYEVVVEFGPRVIVPERMVLRKNDYIIPWYEDYSGNDYAHWTLDNATRVISYLDSLLHQEGIKTVYKKEYRKAPEYSKSKGDYYIIYTASIPCNSNGDI